MWTHDDLILGDEAYPKTVEELETWLEEGPAEEDDDWMAAVTIATPKGMVLYWSAAKNPREWGDKDWERSLDVTCAMLYTNSEGMEENAIYTVMVTYQNAGKTDYEKEMGLIITALYAWVEEDTFQNARMAVNVENLLPVKEVQDYLEEMHFPAYIRSSTYRPT